MRFTIKGFSICVGRAPERPGPRFFLSYGVSPNGVFSVEEEEHDTFDDNRMGMEYADAVEHINLLVQQTARDAFEAGVKWARANPEDPPVQPRNSHKNHNPPCPKCKGVNTTSGMGGGHGIVDHVCSDCNHRWSD